MADHPSRRSVPLWPTRVEGSRHAPPTTLISRFVFGYSLNTYQWCSMRCHYCCNGVQGVSNPTVSSDELREQLLEELEAVPADASLAVGSIADAYPAIEDELAPTRQALEVLAERSNPVFVITKGTGVRRDIDLLAGHPERRVQISLSSLDDTRLLHLEPGTPLASERLACVLDLWDAGVNVSVAVSPWLPDLTDVEAILRELPRDLPVAVRCLDVTLPTVQARPIGAVRQADLTRRFHAEAERVGTPPNLAWAVPPDSELSDRSLFGHLSMGTTFQEWWDRQWHQDRTEDHEGHELARDHLAEGILDIASDVPAPTH